MPARANPEPILTLLEKQDSLGNRDVAALLGITRQAAYQRLRALVAQGLLLTEGGGRSTRYRRLIPRVELGFDTRGLDEGKVWDDLRARVAALRCLGDSASYLYRYVLTELVNNVIAHSEADHVHVAVEVKSPTLALEVADQGLGAFAHLRQRLGLGSELQSIQELSKGRTSTRPTRLNGAGVFFVSHAAERFTLDANGLRWIVDKPRRDQAVIELDDPRPGTQARFEANADHPCDLHRLFSQFARDFADGRARTVVKLFNLGVDFMSRAEARHLAAGLETLREVILDFSGVRGIGQGFADELFRVWTTQHPEANLVPINMNAPVQMMIEWAQQTR
jgi:anti-sigma regulatory factor (Ser/Thr protein kinase)